MRTPAYFFTVEKKEDPQIAVLKKMVSKHNQNSPMKLQVTLKGRWGKKNPDAKGRYQGCPHKSAVKFDVYVQCRKWKFIDNATEIVETARRQLHDNFKFFVFCEGIK